MVDSEMKKIYQKGFLMAKDVESRKVCIRQIFRVMLQGFCNEISGGTTGCFSSEELYMAYMQTIGVLEAKTDDYYSEYFGDTSSVDYVDFNGFIDFLEKTARELFDNIRLGRVPRV